MNKKVLLILGAGKISSNLTGELGDIYTSNIPLPGQLFIDNLIGKSLASYTAVFFTIDISKMELGRILSLKHSEATAIFTRSSDSVATTILNFIQNCNIEMSSLDVIYADSFSSLLLEVDNNEVHDCIYTAISDESENWDYVNRCNEGNLVISKHDTRLDARIITGSFTFSDIPLLAKCLEQVLILNKQRLQNDMKTQAFYESIILYDSELKTQVKLKQDVIWKDLGHRRTYFEQRRYLISESARVFNSLEFNLDKGWVIKRGDFTKIRNEMNWFQQFPDELKAYIPHYEIGKDENSYSTQYVSIIPMNEHWISENVSKDFWKHFFNKTENMLEKFTLYTEALEVEEMKVHKHYMYVDKIIERIDSLEDSMRSKQNISVKFYLLERNKKDWSELKSLVIEAGKKVSGLKHWNLIHGDLCLSNILFDAALNQQKLIDPRGSFGKVGIYGDPLYDLIKLSQCILGDYDYLAANLYKIHAKGDSFSLEYPRPKSHEWIKEFFKEFLLDKLEFYGLDYFDFRLLEAGLLLSAASLHYENDRWFALLLRANQILKEVS